jgi:EmrB/QacA subfamily drug resistance transporter
MARSTAASSAPPADPGEGSSYLNHDQIMLVMVGLMAGMFLAALDQSIVGTALPRIVSDLGGLDKLSWVITAYLLTSTAATPLWGKISDLYGRRIIFQTAIVIFLIGSALCGLSQNMEQLILFRALQGIGGGGLFAIALATIGDIVPPRERGRYQGYFGAVFGVSSVAGPLLGGWFTDGPGWRWIFYINIPIGIAALAIISYALKIPLRKREAKIDYLGAAIIVSAVTSFLLYLNWAGEEYGWTSPQSLWLVGLALILAVVFVFVELRAPEPIIPMHLFRIPTFTIGNSFNFMVGVAMFGAIVFLPLYLQAAKGMSPTESGLGMLPMVFGLFTMSLFSGRYITRTGKYRIFPILGSSIVIVALVLLSRIHADSSYWELAIFSWMFGSGIGMTMQTVVTAVQNVVPFKDMGAATSSTSFFRSLGGAIGTAIFGAILSSRLVMHLDKELATLPAGSVDPSKIDANSIESIHALTEPVKGMVLSAYSMAIDDVFLTAIPFMVVALIIALFLKEVPLRGRSAAPVAEGAAAAEVEEVPLVLSGH